MKTSEQGVLTHLVQIDLKQKKFIVKVRQCTYPLQGSIDTPEGLLEILGMVDKLKLCDSNAYLSFSKRCVGGVKKGVRCKFCRDSMKNERKKEKRSKKNQRQKQLRTARNKRFCRMRKQNEVLKAQVGWFDSLLDRYPGS